MFRMLSNQHYTHRANQKLRSWANAVFQNRGVCGQAVPSFPCPSPVIHFFFFFALLLDEPREETLATQATRTHSQILSGHLALLPLHEPCVTMQEPWQGCLTSFTPRCLYWNSCIPYESGNEKVFRKPRK